MFLEVADLAHHGFTDFRFPTARTATAAHIATAQPMKRTAPGVSTVEAVDSIPGIPE